MELWNFLLLGSGVKDQEMRLSTFQPGVRELLLLQLFGSIMAAFNRYLLAWFVHRMINIIDVMSHIVYMQANI